jgi:YD repeat-containing protein
MTQYAYDTEDNLTSITDASGHVTSFQYNPRGWVTQTTFPSLLLESYDYDAVGNLLGAYFPPTNLRSAGVIWFHRTTRSL